MRHGKKLGGEGEAAARVMLGGSWDAGVGGMRIGWSETQEQVVGGGEGIVLELGRYLGKRKTSNLIPPTP